MPSILRKFHNALKAHYAKKFQRWVFNEGYTPLFELDDAHVAGDAVRYKMEEATDLSDWEVEHMMAFSKDYNVGFSIKFYEEPEIWWFIENFKTDKAFEISKPYFMPHINIAASNDEKIIKKVNIDVYVEFKKDYYQECTNKAKAKLEELESELNQVIAKYFDVNEYSSESEIDNHTYNLQNRKQTF